MQTDFFTFLFMSHFYVFNVPAFQITTRTLKTITRNASVFVRLTLAEIISFVNKVTLLMINAMI